MNTAAHKLALALMVFGLPNLAAAQDISSDQGDETRSGTGSSRSRVVDVTPYIEARQVLIAEIEPGSDTLTYTGLAVGVDATVANRYSEGSIGVRYERRIGWGDGNADGDTISGIARGSMALVPNLLTIEAGGLASRTRVEGDGNTSIGGFGVSDSGTSQIYSAYVGPSVKTNAGVLQVEGHYRFGYTRVETPDSLILTPGSAPIDVFDDSTTHSAQARVGVAPRSVLPIGLSVGGGWNEQNISNLDQRISDRYARVDVTVPVTPSLALVGGVGYEDVEISSRDAVRDEDGNPVIGSDGRYVTGSGPRQIAYETDGLIWDAGVMWRPSARTSLEARVGRRYGSATYYGTFAYAPSERTSFNVSVYDSVNGFGGALMNRLSSLPTQFDALRNPITGDIGGCVASVQGGNCVGSGLGSIRSSVFRNRGIAGSFSRQFGRTSFGLGAGYDNRKFIGATGTVLANANGIVDENIWLAAYASTQLDRQSSLTANGSVNWMDSGFDPNGSAMGYSASLAYFRNLLGGLSGTAAVGLDGITRQDLSDFMAASALLGLRYSF